MKRRGAGRLRHRIVFERRAVKRTNSGGTVEGWETAHGPVAASIDDMRHGEAVIAERIKGTRLCTCTVREPRVAIDPAWRVRDVRSDRTFAIASVAEDAVPRFLLLTLTSGAADA